MSSLVILAASVFSDIVW